GLTTLLIPVSRFRMIYSRAEAASEHINSFASCKVSTSPIHSTPSLCLRKTSSEGMTTLLTGWMNTTRLAGNLGTGHLDLVDPVCTKPQPCLSWSGASGPSAGGPNE